MKGKNTPFSLQPLIILLGSALLLLEVGSYLAYQKHLPTLITELIRYDYAQKNWALNPKTSPSKTVVDTLKIDMSESAFQALSQEWNREFKNKHRINGNPWIDKKNKYGARIKHRNGENDKWQKAEIALMGMLPDHHSSIERMSIKVNLKGDNRLFQKKSFSLVLPETRNFLLDQLSNAVFKESYQGIQIKSIPVWVQFRKNKPLIMLLEERFDKFLVEANERRESIIFEKGYLGHLRDIPGIEAQDIDWACNATLKDSSRQSELAQFVSNAFNDSKRGPFDLIDHKKTMGVWALGMVCGSWHHWVDINMHWYYNPVNHQFEPTLRELNLDPNWLLPGDLSVFENRKNAYRNYLQKIQKEIVQNRPHFLVSYAQWGEQHIPDFWESLDFEVGKVAREIRQRLPQYAIAQMPLAPIALQQYQQDLQRIKTFTASLTQIPKTRQTVSAPSKQIHVKGKHRFEKVVHHNAESHLIVEPGTHIRFVGKSALWKINGSAHFRGTAEQPITIEAEANCAASLFIESQGSVLLEYVIFKGLSNLQYNTWKTPSSVTLYKTHNARISHCQFIDNRRGDDYLNIFACRNFSISDCLFKNALSDAFDSDFSSGTVSHTHFENIGNDGIDGSGSDIVIADCSFNHIKDKAVSSGEKSHFIVKNSLIDNSEIGLVSKDKSTLAVSQTRLRNVRITAAIFQKKPEYGSAQMRIDSDLNTHFYLIEEGSDIQHMGDSIHISENVKDLLYGNEYGSATQK